MPVKPRSVLLLAVLLLAIPAAAAKAVVRMPVGFYDDPSFRWSTQTPQNFTAAAAAHASIVHALVNWAAVAPTQPTNPLSGNDPAYQLSDLDAFVNLAERNDMQVLLTITGTPAWANGNQTPNHPPSNLNDLTQFAQMLASRYSGRHAGLGIVTLYSIWNEPNLGSFLTPQFQGTTIVSPSIYAKLFMAAYKGIKAGNPHAVVAAGETSNRGRDHPSGSPGTDSVAPGTFAKLLAQVAPTLPFVAWATHPYPSSYVLGPNQKVAFPNVSFSTMTEFGQSLQTWFHRPVPIWVTEYGEQTKPFPAAVTYTQQAKDASEALQLAAENPYVQMFIWFIFRDSTSSTWFSGLEAPNGQKKPSYNAFSIAAQSIDGLTQAVKPGVTFTVNLPVPFMLYHDPPGVDVGVSYQIQAGGGVLGRGQPRVPLLANETITFPVNFRPQAGVSYTLSIVVNDKHGQTEKHVVILVPPS